MASHQLALPGFNKKTASASHGGDLAQSKRKTRRPIDPKQALHIVLRASIARGARSLLHPNHCNHVDTFVHKTARKWGVRLYRYANVGNHLHLLVKVPSRTAAQRFLKELAGGIAQLVTGAQKGRALPRKADQERGFWDGLAFTRIVQFGRDYAGVARYLVGNLFEAAGIPLKRLQAQGYRIQIVGRAGPSAQNP
ncbi:MAG: transposase [Oligoflexia bacterium]|nr:transposase [Oligoflexia bacterium]